MTMRTTGRLFQEFWSKFPICVKVRSESGVPACRVRLLSALRIHPILVVLAIASKRVINAEPQPSRIWTYTSVVYGCGNCAETEIRVSDLEEIDKRNAGSDLLLRWERKQRKSMFQMQLKGTKNYPPKTEQ